MKGKNRVQRHFVWLLTILLICMVAVMPAHAAAVKKVKLNKKSTSIYVGKTLTLKATVSPAGASNSKIKWTSSNKKVASVSARGIVKGVKAGKATITAKTANQMQISAL